GVGPSAVAPPDSLDGLVPGEVPFEPVPFELDGVVVVAPAEPPPRDRVLGVSAVSGIFGGLILIFRPGTAPAAPAAPVLRLSGGGTGRIGEQRAHERRF